MLTKDQNIFHKDNIQVNKANPIFHLLLKSLKKIYTIPSFEKKFLKWV